MDDSASADHESRAPNPEPRILIVRPSALGDVSRTVPALVSLRRAYPSARIDWLVAEAFVDAVRHHPDLDGVVPFPRDRMNLARLRALTRRLRAGRYDVVYDLQGLLRSGLFTRLSGAKRRVGFRDAREGAWLGYNVRHVVDPSKPHTVDRMLGLLEADGVAVERDMRLYLGEADRDWLDRFTAEHGLNDGYVCVAPTAKWLCKCWPIGRYIDIARRLDRRIVVLAAPSEDNYVRPMLDALGDHAIFHPTTVGKLMALISSTDLLLCNDSAALHLAVGFDRPTVTLFGPTDPRKVGPYQRMGSVIQPPDAHELNFDYRAQRDDQTIIAKIEADAVWEKVEQTLSP